MNRAEIPRFSKIYEVFRYKPGEFSFHMYEFEF